MGGRIVFTSVKWPQGTNDLFLAGTKVAQSHQSYPKSSLHDPNQQVRSRSSGSSSRRSSAAAATGSKPDSNRSEHSGSVNSTIQRTTRILSNPRRRASVDESITNVLKFLARVFACSTVDATKSIDEAELTGGKVRNGKISNLHTLYFSDFPRIEGKSWRKCPKLTECVSNPLAPKTGFLTLIETHSQRLIVDSVSFCDTDPPNPADWQIMSPKI